MSAPVDVLAVIKRIAETNAAFATTADRDGIVRVGESMLALQAGDLRAVSAAVAELIAERDALAEWQRKTVPMLSAAKSWMPSRKCAMSIREIDAALARVGGATANTMDPLHGKPFSLEPVPNCPQPEDDE